MKRILKIAAISGGAAILLSVILGGISGNVAGVVVVRSLLWGAVFFFLSGGSAFLFETFLDPEQGESEAKAALASDPAGEESAPVEEAAGTNVDIVVDDDPVENQFAALAGSSAFSDLDEGEEPDSVVPAMIEEVVETEIDDVGPAVERKEPAATSPAEEIEELPDIAGAAEDLVVEAPGSDVDDEMDTLPAGGVQKESGGMAGNDPAVIAKALQTMLKRD